LNAFTLLPKLIFPPLQSELHNRLGGKCYARLDLARNGQPGRLNGDGRRTGSEEIFRK
jgi:hypothetical protein